MGEFGKALETIKKARQVGETKVDNKGRSLVWTEHKPGEFDWRLAPGGSVPSNNNQNAASAGPTDSDKMAKFNATIKAAPVESLTKWATNPRAEANLRQVAYDELVERGEDVSGINMDNGTIALQKKFFGTGMEDEEFTFAISDDSKVSPKIWEKVKEIFPDGEIDYKNAALVSKVFNNLSTKTERIAYDNFVDEVKRADEFYQPPMKEINNMNKQIASFIKMKSPFLIVSGGAGVGKSYNFKGVAELCQKRQFDPAKDTPGDGDYDYVEVSEVGSANQLVELLRKHNGKLILFDDADTKLFASDCINIMKKATNPSGVRYVGKETTGGGDDASTFEFTGQIAVLTNKSQLSFLATEDKKAVYTRALKRDIYFTKREQVEYMKPLLQVFEFDDLPRLENAADDIQEREDVFDLMTTHFDRIDPAKMNSRFLREMIMEKRSEEVSDEISSKNAAAAKFFGTGSDWRQKITAQLVKGSVSNRRDITVADAKAILNVEK